MDALRFTPRHSFSEVHGAHAERNFIGQPPRATAAAARSNVNIRKIFQRNLAAIKGWMQSRVKAASINRALAPFIKAAKTDSASVITEIHLKKLKHALTNGTKQHDASLVEKIVRDNVKSFDLAGLKRLKALLEKLASSGTPFEKTLHETVNSSINDAKVRAAKRSLSESLTLFSTLSDNLSDANIILPAIHDHLLTILELVQPAGNDPRKIEFKSASFVITKETLKNWFNGHSLPQKNRIKANLRDIAEDSSITPDSPEADRAMHAFCQSVTTLLGPDDRRHIPTYI